MNKIISYIFNFLFLALAGGVAFYQVNIISSQQASIQVKNPETSQAFYDELKGDSRDYYISSSKDFELYVAVLVPEIENRDSRYSMDIFYLNSEQQELIFSSALVDEQNWQEFYDPLIREYYYKGPEFSQQLSAGEYKVQVYSAGLVLPLTAGDTEQNTANNIGKYVLQIGQEKPDSLLSFLNIYWQLPLLKLTFFKTSVLQFFLTPFAIIGVGALGAILILLALLYYFAGVIRVFIKHQQAKTLLLTSAGMEPMKGEIIKLLQKPAYDITVAFITTASKPQESTDYVNRDLNIMRDEMGFNVEEIDIEGKKEGEVMKLLKLKDIIFVEGGNAFYLLRAMRRCNFEKVVRKLLKEGKVYMGVSAGSIVAGKTIKTAGWKTDKNIIGLRNLKGLNLVPFDIFVHYMPEHAELIKQKIKSPRKRAKKLKILTDEQAILVQGKDVALIGGGEEIVI